MRVPCRQLGVIPGSGGTQRLTHAIGKSRAMEIILSGKNFSAQEAADWGLVSRIVSEKHEETVQEAIKIAEKICSKGWISTQAAKEAINAGEAMLISSSAGVATDIVRAIAYELPLSSGLTFERRMFHMLFATVSPFSPLLGDLILMNLVVE